MVSRQIPRYSAGAAPLTAVSAQRMIEEILVASGVKPNGLILKENDFATVDFDLGDVLTPINPAQSWSSNSPQDFYLVGQGRVRLLGFDEQNQQEVSLQVLDVGSWFGGDSLLSPLGCYPYRAIAAHRGRVYRVAHEILASWIAAYPGLGNYLAKSTSIYQRIGFFRSDSQLHGESGPKIKALAERSEDLVIPAQTSLLDFCRDFDGRFWLRSGSICGQGTPPPAVGESWLGGDHIPPQWYSEQELVVVYLPPANCDRPDLSPILQAQDAMESTTKDADCQVVSPLPAKTRGRSPESVAPFRPIPAQTPSPLQGAHPPSAAETAVVFPKPLQRQLLDRLDRYPWVEQQSSSDCGAACLAMVARYWGKRLPIHLLREQANVGRSGASLKGLSRAAENIGFHARPVRASLGRIAEQTNPWIAHWQGDHYVVVYKITRHQVILADPALGKRVISHAEFKAHWTGYGLLLDPTERLKGVEAKQASLGRYVKLLLPYQSLIFQVILVSLLIQVFSLVTPLFTQIILDKVVVQKSMSTLNVFAAGLLMFSVWSLALSTIRSYLLAYFSIRLDLTMVSGFIRHAISLPLKFYESRRVGDIITRVQENQKIQRFLIGQVMLAWLGFLTGFVYLGLMLYYNLQLTLMVMALIPPIVIITLVSTPFLRRISREVFKEAANQNSTLVEMMNGVAAVKSAGVEQEVRWRWEETLVQLNNVGFKGQKFGIGLGALNGAVNTLGSTALLWLGASMVIQDQLTIGQFVAFNMMIGYVLSPVVALANLWDELQEIFISVERLNDVFEAQPEEPPGQPMLVLPPVQGEVVFDRVTFRYDDDDDNNTLENLSFRVEPGQTIAIVGRSGSGKTTLVKLLEGLYHPRQGRIFVDGNDIRHVSPHSLRTQLGVVPQECFLFSGTLLDNITLYRQEFSLAEVIEAAKLAEAHAFIQALPLGYNTKVGERGSTLSGGQRQRIAIARALLGNPQILILDEATSSLDTESERRFQRNLAQISRDRTTFIIAHRLSTVRNADRILVLDKGILVEAGTHEELLHLQGLYHSLAQQQLDI